MTVIARSSVLLLAASRPDARPLIAALCLVSVFILSVGFLSIAIVVNRAASKETKEEQP